MDNYKDFAIHLARLSGEIIKKNFVLGMKKEWKADHTPLTETDTQINQLVIDAIQAKFPHHSVLAEEGNAFQKDAEYLWACDPVDGTIPFSHGIPTCVFSLGLIKNGESVLGVVFDPFMDRLLFAETGAGATMNGEPIHVSGHTSIEHALVGLCAYSAAQFDLMPLYRTLQNSGSKVYDLKSVTYMYALVALGESPAVIFPGRKIHDSVAMHVIIEEAGGRVSDLLGRPLHYDADSDVKGFLMSNGKVHNQLLQILKPIVAA